MRSKWEGGTFVASRVDVAKGASRVDVARVLGGCGKGSRVDVAKGELWRAVLVKHCFLL